MPSKKRGLDLNESASSNRKKLTIHPGAGTAVPTGAISKKTTSIITKVNNKIFLYLSYFLY